MTLGFSSILYMLEAFPILFACLSVMKCSQCCWGLELVGLHEPLKPSVGWEATGQRATLNALHLEREPPPHVNGWKFPSKDWERWWWKEQIGEVKTRGKVCLACCDSVRPDWCLRTGPSPTCGAERPALLFFCKLPPTTYHLLCSPVPHTACTL